MKKINWTKTIGLILLLIIGFSVSVGGMATNRGAAYLIGIFIGFFVAIGGQDIYKK